MLVLAFDTATAATTVALHDGSAVLASRTAVDPRRHAELLAPAIDAVLREAGAERRDVTDVVVGVGPGPFTGLRVGLVTARSLGYVLGVPVHGLCTLDVLAGEHRGDGPFLAVNDARRREVYWARYGDPGTRLAGPAVDRPGDVPDRGLPAVGHGAALYPDAFPDARPPEYPSATVLAALTVARLGEGGGPGGQGGGSRRLPTEPPEPLYLRRPDARLPGPRKQVTPTGSR